MNGRICLDEPENGLDNLSTRDSTFEYHYYQMMSILRIARPAAARWRSSLRTAVVIISEPTTGASGVRHQSVGAKKQVVAYGGRALAARKVGLIQKLKLEEATD
jgi:hypothetical protein